MKIANKEIGEGKPVFIIAEAGVNHNGDLELAKKLVYAAVEAGVDAVKFQTFRAENLVTEYASKAEYQKETTGTGESQYQMLKKLELSEENHIILKDYCNEKSIIFCSTPHSSIKDVDLLDKIGVPLFKFGSGDLTNLPLLSYAAKKGKVMIVSTGMANEQEIKEAKETIEEAGNNDVVFLQCTTSYPCPAELANVQAMTQLKNVVGGPVGYSDHTTGNAAAAAATALGAAVIEKHFTLDKNMKGPDHKASLEPDELKNYVNVIRFVRENNIPPEQVYESVKKELNIDLESDIHTILGHGKLEPFPVEIEIAKVARKSIVAAHDISADTVLKESDLAIKRPATGIAPKFMFGKYDMVVGKKLNRSLKKDEQLSFGDIS